MTKNLDLLNQYNDINCAIWTAAKGTTLPTSPYTPYPAGFYEVGFTDDTGIVESLGMQVTKKYAWQGAVLAKKIKSQAEKSFDFTCIEENPTVLGLTRPGTTMTTTAGTSEVQTLTITATGGSFVLAGGSGGTGATSAISLPTTAAAVQTAVRALPGFSAAVAAGTAGSITITFAASEGNVNPLTVDQTLATGGTVTLATTTPGILPYYTGNVGPWLQDNSRVWGIDLISDKGFIRRFLLAKAELDLSQNKPAYTANDWTAYKMTLDCFVVNGSWYTEITNNPSFAPGQFV